MGPHDYRTFLQNLRQNTFNTYSTHTQDISCHSYTAASCGYNNPPTEVCLCQVNRSRNHTCTLYCGWHFSIKCGWQQLNCWCCHVRTNTVVKYYRHNIVPSTARVNWQLHAISNSEGCTLTGWHVFVHHSWRNQQGNLGGGGTGNSIYSVVASTSNIN